MTLQQAVTEALNELGEVEVRYRGDRMSINQVLYRLVAEKFNDDEWDELIEKKHDFSYCNSCDAEDGTSCIASCVCKLDRWTVEPHENDLYGAEAMSDND